MSYNSVIFSFEVSKNIFSKSKLALLDKYFFLCHFFSSDHQPLHLRHRVAAGKYFPQKVGRQEMAQHGQSELYQEELQAMAGRQEHAGYRQKGIRVEQNTQILAAEYVYCVCSAGLQLKANAYALPIIIQVSFQIFFSYF